MQLIGLISRTKYYGAWSLTEVCLTRMFVVRILTTTLLALKKGAAILSGLGFSGYTASGHARWDKTANIHIKNIELAPNFKILLDSWNINANVWLRNCVYKRVTPKGQRPGFRSSMLTFLASALWVSFII